MDDWVIPGAEQSNDGWVIPGASTPAPAKTEGPLGEIGTGLKRGALVGLPTMVGKALQYTSEPGNTTYNIGSYLAQNAKERGEQASYQLHPEAHNVVTNAIAGGAEAAGPMLPAVAAGLVGGPLAGGAVMAATAAATGGQAGQETLEKAREKGVPEAEARTAARLDAAQNFGVQLGLGAIGGKLIGVGASALGKVVGRDAGALASSTLDALTGANGIIKPLIKQIPAAAGEAVALGATQAAIHAKIENTYGIDETSPLQAAKDSIVPMLGLTAVMTPLGLAGRTLAVRAAKGRTDALASAETHPDARGRLAEQYASALEQVNPDAAANFRENAKTAIEGKQALPVDSGLFTKGAIQPTPPVEEPPAPLQLENNPSPMIVFPDGTASRNWQDAESYLNGLPEDQRVDARAKLFGFGPERVTGGPEVNVAQDAVRAELTKAGITPAEPMSFAEVASALKEEAKKQGQTLTQSDIADIYQAHQQDVEQANMLRLMKEREPKEAVAPEASTKAEIPAEPPRLNSQISDALERAQDEKNTRDQATQIDTAYQQAAAGKERDLTAIQNIAKGDELARAAETGQPISNTETLPLPHTEFLSRLAEVKDADQAMPSKLKQDVTQAVRGAKTLDDQVKAIGELRDGKKETSVSYELLDKLHNKLLEERPAEVAPEAKAADEAAPEAQTVTEKAQTAADKLDSTLADFNDRARKGEQFTPLEQERFDHAQNFRRVLASTLANMTPDKETYVKDLTEFAKQTEQPYTKSFDAEYRGAANPNERSIDLVRQLIQPDANADSVLAHLSEHGTEPWVKTMAEKLRGLGLDTKMELSMEKNIDGADGQYNGIKNTISIAQGGENEHVVLHELTHAATVTRIIRASEIDTPRNQDEARLKKAYTDIEGLRQEALKRASADDHYGLTDAKEFIAELNTNPDFQKFLGEKNLWQRAVDAVRRLLGMDPSSKTALDKALSAQGEFFSSENYKSYLADKAARADPQALSREFNASYKGAGAATDTALSSIAEAADKIGINANIVKNMSRVVFQALAGAKTVSYIADRARAIPEMVAAGLARGADGVNRGVDRYQQAHEIKRLASNHLEQAATEVAHRVEKLRHEAKNDSTAREQESQMTRLAGESSRIGSDLRMNAKDNIEAHPQLADADKAYMDALHREFTQLERSNPAAAKAILDGEKANRKGYIQDNAQRIAGMLDGRIGNMRRAAAELDRMDPADVNRAKQTDVLKAATVEGQFAMKHAAGLDFMDKALAKERNGDTYNHLDGESFTLGQRINSAFMEAKLLPEGSLLRDQMGELEKIYNNQVNNPYYSLGRNGDYFVSVKFKDMDPATWAKMQDVTKGTPHILGALNENNHAYFKVNTIDEAQGLHRKLMAAGGDKIFESAKGKVSDVSTIRSQSSLTPALQSILATLHDTVETNGVDPIHAQALKDALTRNFMSMLPETSSAKAKMQRQGIPGYSADFLSSFARRASMAVQDTANIYASRHFSEAFKEMKDAVTTLNKGDDIEVASRAQTIHDEMSKRYNEDLNPATSKVADAVNTITNMGHAAYLAASPGYIIRTMAQPWHRGLPYVGSKYGFVNSAKAMAADTSAALKIISNTIKQGWNEGGARGLMDAELNFKGLGLDAKTEAFMQEMHDRGVLNFGQTRQLQRMAMGGDPRKADITRLVAMTAQYAEMGNRLIMGLAAFHLADKASKGENTAKNTEYAIKAVNDTMDNFDRSNTARLMGKNGIAGVVTPLMTEFMQYNMQTMQQIARTVHDGVFNVDKSPEGQQRAKEAKRELAGIFATTTMIAGVMGLPFANAIAGVYNFLNKDDDNPHDIRTDVKNSLSDTFGQEFGDIISHGIGSAVGVSTANFGMQDLLPGTAFLDSRRLMKDRIDEQSKQLLGPALNFGTDLLNGLSKISDGYYVKGIEQMLPAGLKSYYKAAELAGVMGPGGYTDAKGNQIGMEATPWDVAVQAVGLQPADKATRSEAAMDFYTNQQLLTHRSGVIKDEIYKAYTDHDQDAIQSALSNKRAFDAQNPMQPIRDLAGTFRQHAIEMATAKMTGTGVGVGARKVPLLQSQERFAAMPKP